MTVAAALSKWLAQLDTMTIDTNHITDGADKYGLFKAPTRTLRERIDGSYEITEYYQFFARQAAVSEADRQDADEWLENLTYMVDDAGYKYELPTLNNNRTATAIALTGAPYPMESESEDTLYQMSLSITYVREREVS